MLRGSFIRLNAQRFKLLWDLPDIKATKSKHIEVLSILESINSSRQVLGWVTPLIHAIAKLRRRSAGQSTDIPEIKTFENWNSAEEFMDGLKFSYSELLRRLYTRDFKEVYDLVSPDMEKNLFSAHSPPVWIPSEESIEKISEKIKTEPVMDKTYTDTDSSVESSEASVLKAAAEKDVNTSESVKKSSVSEDTTKPEATATTKIGKKARDSEESVFGEIKEAVAGLVGNINGSSNSDSMSSSGSKDSNNTMSSSGDGGAESTSSREDDTTPEEKGETTPATFRTDVRLVRVSGPKTIEVLSKVHADQTTLSSSIQEQARSVGENMTKEEKLHLDCEGVSYNSHHGIERIDRFRLTSEFNITKGICAPFRCTEFENVYNKTQAVASS